MGWVTRGSKRHYVRSVRRGRRVAHEYYGSGTDAELAAALDADRRRDRDDDRDARARAEAAWAAACGPLDRLEAGTEELIEAVLLAAGYRRHHLGEWRLRRDHDRRADDGGRPDPEPPAGGPGPGRPGEPG